MPRGRPQDLQGKRFGQWEVLRCHQRGNPVYWWCRCKCGTERAVSACQLRRSKNPSCGCAVWGRPRPSGVSRGQSKDPEYRVWISMRSRCYNPKSTPYANYGGRGIKVCDRWLGEEGYFNFIADMGRRPTPQHTIERIDNDGDYCPDNCRWASRREQALNRRVTRLIEFQGEKLTSTDWAKRTGIHKNTIDNRIAHGWTPEQALTVPACPESNPKRLIKVYGRWMSMRQAVDLHGIPLQVIQDRIGRGWDPERAVSTPKYPPHGTRNLVGASSGE